MDLNEARTLALSLMTEHGLIEKGWTLNFTHARSRFGSCSYRTRTINLSRPHSEVNDLADVRDTILHEIAHALAGPTAKHGPAWKAIAARLGATPKASSKKSKLNDDTTAAQMYGIGDASGLPKFHVGDIITSDHPRLRGKTLTVTRVNAKSYSAVEAGAPMRWTVPFQLAKPATASVLREASAGAPIRVGDEVIVKHRSVADKVFRVVRVNTKTYSLKEIGGSWDGRAGKSLVHRAPAHALAAESVNG